MRATLMESVYIDAAAVFAFILLHLSLIRLAADSLCLPSGTDRFEDPVYHKNTGYHEHEQKDDDRFRIRINSFYLLLSLYTITEIPCIVQEFPDCEKYDRHFGLIVH